MNEVTTLRVWLVGLSIVLHTCSFVASSHACSLALQTTENIKQLCVITI